jgi:hypothetical protein
VVSLSHSFLELELGAQFGFELIGRVPNDGEAAAPCRAVWRERGDDGGTSRLHCLHEARAVSLTIQRVCQKVENGTVVPYVHRRNRPVARDVGFDPLNAVGRIAQPRLCSCERRARNVEDAHAPDFTIEEEEFHEAGIPASNIQHSSIP